jgi:hypothetical protein
MKGSLVLMQMEPFFLRDTTLESYHNWRINIFPTWWRQHCMVHKTNLIVQVLFNSLVVTKFKDLFHSLYSWFSSSLKWHLESNNLVVIVEIIGLKILKNVKSWWLLEPLKHVLAKYQTMIMKMSKDSLSIAKCWIL